jgi:PEP-CTERM motif
MKVKLAVAFAILSFGASLLAGAVRADTPSNPFVLPDGSTVTSVEFEPIDVGGYYFVDFTFADGTGEAQGSVYEGEGVSLFFTVPVSNLIFDWSGQFFSASDNTGDNVNYTDTEIFSGTLEFAGPGITRLDYGSNETLDGITSISYTLDPASMPEPSSLLLLGMGLAALIGLARRVTVC